MTLRYTLGAIFAIPLLPIMYFQGKKIRESVPVLPEAEGNSGSCNPAAVQKIQLLVLGESTIAGVGVQTHEEGFSGTLASEIARLTNTNVHWKVYAKSGLTSRKMVEKTIPRIVETHADLIVIGMGANDAFTLNHPKKWRENVTQVIIDLRKKYPEVPIVFNNMPPIKAFPAFTTLIKFVVGNLVEILGLELKKVVKNFNNVYYESNVITFEDWTKRHNLSPDVSEFFSDGVHPSKLTYQTWAKDMAQFIDNQNIIK